MPEDINGKIGTRMSEVEGDFNKLQKEREELVKNRNDLTNQISTIDRRLNEIQAGQISLQGRYAELKALSDKPEPELKIPKEKPNKKKN